MPLSKTKQGDARDMEDSDVAEEQVEEELGDATEADEAPLGHQQMRVQFERLLVRQD